MTTNHTDNINQALREEGFHYTFADLRDRFAKGLAEAEKYGDDYVCVKVPSATEFSAPDWQVRQALRETPRRRG